METKFWRSMAAVLVMVTLLLLACQSTAAVSIPTATATLLQTDTPVPPTDTATLTFTPTLTSTPTETFTTTATQTPPPVVYGPKSFPTNVDPLTGLKVADPQILDRPARAGESIQFSPQWAPAGRSFLRRYRF